MTNIYWSSKIGRRRGGGSRYRGEFDCSISLINMWILEDFSAPSTNKLNEELKEAAFNTKEKCTLKEKWDRLWNDVSQRLFFLRIVATSCQRHLQNKKNLFVSNQVMFLSCLLNVKCPISGLRLVSIWLLSSLKTKLSEPLPLRHINRNVSMHDRSSSFDHIWKALLTD